MTGGFLYGYMTWSNADWGAFFSYQWIWGLIGAVVSGAILIMLVARQAVRSKSPILASTSRPEGLHLVGALLWESAVYGIAEAILLSVLPALITWQGLSAYGWTQSWIGVVFTGLLALVASLFVIVVHHLGYREFRGPQVAGAAVACGILTLAFLLTMNPIAAMGGHIILHAGAILRGAGLPPHQEEGVKAVEHMVAAQP
ncbi:MAG: hypothetical protein ACXVDN_13515 [Ktedonobacteraceae bacterium]